MLIKIYNPLGMVSMSGDYFAGLVSTAAKSCYGVRGMVSGSATDHLRSTIFSSYYPDKGVRVTEENGSLNIELHIQVVYGLNIAAIVRSITNKVKYAVEDATSLRVAHIDVFVDDIV